MCSAASLTGQTAPTATAMGIMPVSYTHLLTEAALHGRDILWDQNGKYNLPIRQLLESVYTNSVSYTHLFAGDDP